MTDGADAAAHLPVNGSDPADETTGSAGESGTAGGRDATRHGAAGERDSTGHGAAGERDATGHGARWWVAASVAVLFGLFYAYDLFEAISNLLGVAQLNGLAAEAGVAPVVPWALPIVGVASPPVAYVAALLIGRRRSLGVRALLLLAGLAVVAAVTLSITALA